MENIRGFVNKPAYFRATYRTRKATAADKNFKKIFGRERLNNNNKKVEFSEYIQITIG